MLEREREAGGGETERRSENLESVENVEKGEKGWLLSLMQKRKWLMFLFICAISHFCSSPLILKEAQGLASTRRNNWEMKWEGHLEWVNLPIAPEFWWSTAILFIINSPLRRECIRKSFPVDREGLTVDSGKSNPSLMIDIDIQISISERSSGSATN